MAKQLRISSNKMLTGTAAGVAEYFDLDPNIGRIGFVVVSLLSAGIGVLAYLAIYFIVSSNK